MTTTPDGGPLPPDLPEGAGIPELVRAIAEQSGLPLGLIARELGVHRQTLRKYADPEGTADPSLPWPTWARRIRKLAVFEGGTIIVLHPASKAHRDAPGADNDATTPTRESDPCP